MSTSARLLRLLSLLQTPRDWTGSELADRLEVSQRTIRNDIDRLRALGYPVHATRGSIGGYRLEAGATLPPLLLDDEEAVAVAIGLRTATGGAVTGIEETSLRALAKLEQVLPPRLRSRVSAIQASTLHVRHRSGPTVDPAVLTELARICREHSRLRFDYSDRKGAASQRRVEPERIVNSGQRWYLVAWDTDRADWRTFRVDRIVPGMSAGPRFAPRELSDRGGGGPRVARRPAHEPPLPGSDHRPRARRVAGRQDRTVDRDADRGRRRDVHPRRRRRQPRGRWPSISACSASTSR